MNRYQNASLRSATEDTHPRRVEAQALRAASIFERVFQQIQEQGSLNESTLAHLVRESFAAGFAAGASRATPKRAESRSGEPNVPRSSLADLVGALTPRRFEVLELVARGLTNREIARVMGISTNTVKAHLAGVLEALDLTNRTEAAVALREYEAEQDVAPHQVELLPSVSR